MPLGVAFWIIFLLWILSGAIGRWPTYNAGAPLIWGGDLLLLLLVLCLGWHDFGAIISR